MTDQAPDSEPVIDAEAVEISEEEETRRNERAYREVHALPVPTAAALAPQTAADLVERRKLIRDAAKQGMEEGVDYGKVPGTDRDALFKPGSEGLAVLFRLDVQPENEKRWEEGGHLTVISRAIVYDATTGNRLGSGEGICTTREKKYAMRKGSRKCPECGAEAIIKGKAEYGGGWLCFGKKGGCGAKWDDGSEEAKAFEAEQVGEIPNPDLPDLWNTCDKMASKRARVDAVLAVTGASAIFTQDLDEQAEDVEPAAPAMPLATGEQHQKLERALAYLLPPGVSDRTLDKILARGELYGPVCDAVALAIGARKAVEDDEKAEAQEARNAEEAAQDG